MSDSRKTKAQLIEELQALRTRVAHLDNGNAPCPTASDHERRKRLLQVIHELSLIEDLDEFCRRAVELGRERLGFDRLGIWFIDEADPRFVNGSFGTDRHGRTVDERRQRLEFPGAVDLVRQTKGVTVVHREEPLLDDGEKVLDRGERALAPLLAKGRVLGLISTDNLIHQRPITAQDEEVLVVYATSLGQLCARLRDEEALRKREILLNETQSLTKVGGWGIDLITGRGSWTDQAYRIYGLPVNATGPSPEQAMDFFHPEDRPVIERAFRRAVEEGVPYDLELRFTSAKGRELWVRTTARPTIGEDGRVTRIVGNIMDITERKRTEELLRREKDLSETIIDSLPGVFYVFDDRNRFLRWNKNFEEASGYSAEEFAQMGLLDFFEGDDKALIADRVKQALTTGRAEAEADLILKDGTRRPYYFTGLRMALGGRSCVVGMGIDITERKRLQRQLLRAQKMESIGTLASGVAHNFNNILSVILGNAELVRLKLGTKHTVSHFLDKIASATERAAGLAQQLLAVARQLPGERSVMNLTSVLQSIAQAMRVMLDSNIQVQLRGADDLPSLEANHVEIEQALMNICLNARDAMPKGGTIRIEGGVVNLPPDFCAGHHRMRPGRHARISIRDTGIGMAPEVLENAFDPFFTTKGPDKGIGLGLSMTYTTIVNHGGCIEVDSEQGKGTTFRIFLPAAVGDAPTDTPADKAPLLHGRETVLVVDDEEDVVVMARDSLESLGYTVLVARNGREALDVYARESSRIDLVLLDYMMPELDGEDALHEFRRANGEIKIVLASGYDKDGELRPLFEAGVDGFIAKPFRLQELSHAVRTALDSE